MELRSIQSTAQQVAEAIAAALKMEVEIADSTLLRIAGTGLYRDGVLQSLVQDGHVFQHVLSGGLPVVLRNPGHHSLCKPCPHYGDCKELAEVAVPIEYQGGVCGVISLIARDQDQRRRLLSDADPLIQFLSKMADLLTTKLREQAMIRERSAAASQLEMVMNYVDRGIIALKGDGVITHANAAASGMLGSRIMVGQPLDKLVPSLPLDQDRTAAVQHPVQWRRGRQPQTLVFTITPIRQQGRCIGTVVTIDDESHLARLLTSYANQAQPCGVEAILGHSPEVSRIKALLPQIAQGEATVMISGESGTGKELIAQAIHTLSHRSGGPFIAVNCAAIPEGLLESELFGYEAGAFTGARQGGKLGKFQLAEGGTLFLDEVGDMPLHLQGKLLRVLQQRSLERLGGTTAIPINVRVLAATNRPLEVLIKTGEFREDLYYRLNVIPLLMPPLRERREDIALLARHFLQTHAARADKEIAEIDPEAAWLLERYSWPGNIRELANAMEYAVTMESGRSISVCSLPPKLREPQPAGPPETVREPGSTKPGTETARGPAVPGGLPTLNLGELERQALVAALSAVRAEYQPKERAADLLGISRATFFRKLREYGLN